MTILRTFSFLVPHSRHLNLIRLNDFTIPTVSRGRREEPIRICDGWVLFRPESPAIHCRYPTYILQKAELRVRMRDKTAVTLELSQNEYAESQKLSRKYLVACDTKVSIPARFPGDGDSLYSVLRSITGLYGSETRWYREALWETM